MNNNCDVWQDTVTCRRILSFSSIGLIIIPDTGWIEIIETGWNVLVDANKELIIDKAFSHEPPVNAPENLYGDGRAGEKIANIVSSEVAIDL